MFLKWYLFIAFVCFNSYEAAFVETLKQCSLSDEKCLGNYVENIIRSISTVGIEEYHIPPLDPIEFKDLHVSIVNVFNITLEEATVRGIKDCSVTGFKVIMNRGKAVMNWDCKVIDLNGKYKIDGSAPLFKQLFGSDVIRGDGNFKLRINKIKATINFYFNVDKMDNGELFINFHEEEFRYKYDFEDAKIEIDSIYLGNNDASKLISDFMNQNFKFIMQNFGNAFFDLIIDTINNLFKKFFDHTPAKYITGEDLSAYLK